MATERERDRCRERLEPLMVPTHVDLVRSLPQTLHGKIDKLRVDLKVKLARFGQSLGREPTPRERWRLEREAVVDSRPPKPDAKPARLARDEWAAR